MDRVEANLKETVAYLSGVIGERSYRHTENLARCAEYIERRFSSCRCGPRRQTFTYGENIYCNIFAEVAGTEASRNGMLVVGAHYDTVAGSPGADDNASGVAGLLELARLASEKPMKRTVRFVAFSLEEPPVFMTSRMGSYVHAKGLRDEGAVLFGMVSLEMLGYYRSDKGSQLYPSSLFRLFYPDRGDFISFVGNLSSRSFTLAVKRAFQEACSFPVESLNAPALIPGVDFSDHRSFWKFGYSAFMITDTAFYRNPNYHSEGDTMETLDYPKMAELTTGLYTALSSL
jgi:Zn-dependent M28 family amino/carboxypeptidase